MSADDQRRIRLEAAHWLAMLHSGDMSLQDEADFADWQRRSPQHARCIAQLNEKILQFQASPLRDLKGDRLHRALSQPSSRRSFLRGSLALAGTAVAMTLLSRVGRTGIAWPGDLYTGVGERAGFTLDDGSRLNLNAASRVTPRFSSAQRALTLHAGELMIDVQARPQPLWITTPTLTVQARQQRLLLRQQAAGSYVLALDDELQLRTAGGWFSLRRGNWALVADSGEVVRGVVRHDATLWLKGLLEADGQSLGSVIEALRPYRRGLIQLAAQVADLRISGLLPLDDSDHALQMLTSIAPVRVTRMTDLWVKVEAA